MGKIGDIFAHRGVSEVRKAPGNLPLFDKTLAAMDDAADGDLVFANFVDFDTKFGHRRDVAGYAAALEAFDRRLPEALAKAQIWRSAAAHRRPWLRPDLAWHRSHARARAGFRDDRPAGAAGSVGLRSTYADIGETIAAHLGLEKGAHGTPFARAIAGMPELPEVETVRRGLQPVMEGARIAGVETSPQGSALSVSAVLRRAARRARPSPDLGGGQNISCSTSRTGRL